METLNEYFSYNFDVEVANQIFLKLDNKLKKLHSEGKYVNISADKILVSDDYEFIEISTGLTEEMRMGNIKTLAKLAAGTYFSLPSGTFYDYSQFPDENFKKYFDNIEPNIPLMHPDDSYYREVLINDNISYYNDYLDNLKERTQGQSNQNNRVLTYSTQIGKAMTNKEESAFIDIVFYPLVISLGIIMSYMIYILTK